MVLPPTLLWLANDPGLPEGGALDPYAGLSESAARELRGEVEGLDEAKAIGTADLGGGVAARDAALRVAQAARPTASPFHVRAASTNALRDLAPVEEEARRAVGLLLRMWLRGAISTDDVQLQTAKRWREAYERVREIGRKSAALDRHQVDSAVLREEESWFRSAVKEELGYWHVFLDEIEAGKVQGKEAFLARQPAGRLYERVEAYLSALGFMYDAARTYALPRDTLVYWMGPKTEDPSICEGCVYLVERSPFPKDLLPSVPKDGTTSCLVNCRHKIVVRVARSLADVQRRRAALPLREVMVEELRRIKEAHHGTHRQHRAKQIGKQIRKTAANPFHGTPLSQTGGVGPAPKWGR